MPRRQPRQPKPGLDAQLHVRLSKTNKAAIQQNAVRAGFSSASDYVRWLDKNFSDWLEAGKVPDGAIRSKSQPKKRSNDQLVYEVNKIGVNLMQLLRAVHRFQPVTEHEIKTVLNRIDEVWDIILDDSKDH